MAVATKSSISQRSISADSRAAHPSPPHELGAPSFASLLAKGGPERIKPTHGTVIPTEHSDEGSAVALAVALSPILMKRVGKLASPPSLYQGTTQETAAKKSVIYYSMS